MIFQKLVKAVYKAAPMRNHRKKGIYQMIPRVLKTIYGSVLEICRSQPLAHSGFKDFETGRLLADSLSLMKTLALHQEFFPFFA